MAFDLTGRVALVTGGGRGIGAAIVTRLAEAGAAVVAANRTIEAADGLASALGARGLGVEPAPFDDLTRRGLTTLVDGIAGRHGRLDILVHNAGGCPWASLESMTEAKLDEALDVNLKACFWLAQAAIPHMRKTGFGRILITSSIASRVAMADGIHYSAAKAGANAFIRGAGFALARDGITVNGVEPGFIAKPGRGTLSTPQMQAKIGAQLPMGHYGEPDDIAYAMLYLASPEAKYITGQTIVVDGGLLLPETGFAIERAWGKP